MSDGISGTSHKTFGDKEKLSPVHVTSEEEKTNQHVSDYVRHIRTTFTFLFLASVHIFYRTHQKKRYTVTLNGTRQVLYVYQSICRVIIQFNLRL